MINKTCQTLSTHEYTEGMYYQTALLITYFKRIVRKDKSSGQSFNQVNREICFYLSICPLN